MSDGKTIEERAKEYDEIRRNAEELYATFKPVKCLALGDEIVHFTSEGFNHLVYNKPKKMRDIRAQILRFDMLERAKFVIETSTTYQEYDEEIRYKKVNRHGKHVEMPVVVRSWGLVAIVRNFRVKVVIKQEGNGKKEFYSVIPAWFTKQYRNIKMIQSSTGKGLLSEDDDEVLKNATRGGAL